MNYDWQKLVKRARPAIRTTTRLLEPLFYARGGGPVALGLAGIAVAGAVADLAYPSNPWDEFPGKGQDGAVGRFLLGQLRRNLGEPKVLAEGDGMKAISWPSIPVGFMLHENRYEEGPFFPEGEGREAAREVLADVIREAVWTGQDLVLVPLKSKEEVGFGKPSGGVNLDITPMGEPGMYVGRREASWYAEKLQKYEGRPRTIMFRGPTGVGKSVLGRLIAREMSSNPRVLKISSDALKSMEQASLLGVVHYLKPTVLLLDDLDMKNRADDFLAVLESLREEGVLVVITIQDDEVTGEEDPKPGSWYFSGMRPGRVDDMYLLGPPGESERFQILGAYLKGVDYDMSILSEVARQTEGLTGAYLMNLAEHFALVGFDGWEHEVNKRLWAAPARRTKSSD